MNKLQHKLLAVYIPLTLLILVLDRVFPDNLAVRILKFSAMFSLFLWALIISKSSREQKLLNLALFFAAAGDFFLGFGSYIQFLGPLAVPLGMLSFSVSYLILSKVFLADASPFKSTPQSSQRKYEFITAIVILLAFTPVLISLIPFVHGVMLGGALIFSLILCYMAWSAITTLFRKHFSPQTSRRMAFAGILIFLCDIAVAFSLFDPKFSGIFIPWLENIIWATFIPAWTLIVLVIAEQKLRVNPKITRFFPR